MVRDPEHRRNHRDNDNETGHTHSRVRQTIIRGSVVRGEGHRTVATGGTEIYRLKHSDEVEY